VVEQVVEDPKVVAAVLDHTEQTLHPFLVHQQQQFRLVEVVLVVLEVLQILTDLLALHLTLEHQ